MKLAVISDIHGNLFALQAVLADIARQSVDQTVNLGDMLSGPLQPLETADLLMAQNFLTIRGNHERQMLTLHNRPGDITDITTSDGHAASQLLPAHWAWLRSLHISHALGDEVLLCHGTPASDLNYLLETVVPDFEQDRSTGVRAATPAEVVGRLGQATHPVVLCGHTHVPRRVQSGGVLIVNPGSVGLPAYDDVHPHPHVIETGSPHARYALLKKTGLGWQVKLRAVPYDHLAQAAVAACRGREDWAHALATGFVKRPVGF